MRILQIVVAKLLAFGVFTAGVIVLVMRYHPEYLHTAKELFLQMWGQYGNAIGAAMGIAGILALCPLKKPRRPNTISFPGSHGDVTIQLDSVEATLSRVVNKMPEVKKISVRVTPSEDSHRAQVTADVWMYKSAEAAGAREIANRISDFLADTAVNILGVEDITTINLNVRGVIVDGGKTSVAPAVAVKAAAVKNVVETPELAKAAEAEVVAEMTPAAIGSEAGTPVHPAPGAEESTTVRINDIENTVTTANVAAHKESAVKASGTNISEAGLKKGTDVSTKEANSSKNE